MTGSPTSVHAWAGSGAMALSGAPGAPPCGPPARLVPGVAALGRRIEAASAATGTPVALDWLALLGERAALDGLARAGRTSCGGATRLLPAADGWLAVTMGRADDLAALPAWLGRPVATDQDGDATWSGLAAVVAGLPTAELVARAGLLGLPVAALGERAVEAVAAAPAGPAPARGVAGARVVDLSSLWAGPLAGAVLAAAGADVVKVESTARPDAVRHGSPRFFHLLNADKRSVAVDLDSPAGRATLAHLVAGADVVIESTRPRALAHLGMHAADELARPGGPQVWVSITGHGRSSPRVAFGDDAAVAGGLVVDGGAGPWFCADAVADPLTGLAAAAAALEALAEGGRWLLDVALAGVAAAHAGPTLAADGLAVAPPRARRPTREAPPLGADTEAVLARW